MGRGRGWRHENVCECVKKSGNRINVFALGEGVGQLSLDLSLRPHELGRLQGFPDGIASFAANKHSLNV